LLDLIAAFLVRGLNRILHVMPIGAVLWLGRRLGALGYFLSGKRNRVTYANLKAAFCDEKSPGEIKKITRGVYRNAGQTFAEILSMTRICKENIDKYVHIENFERVIESAKNPGGMILVSAHFGNWELSTVAGAFKGFKLYLLARDQKMERLNELLNLLRESKGNVVIRKGLDVKNIFRLLRDGKSIGILGDQNAGASGVLIDFFGRPASTAVGPYRFAQKTGASIVPSFIHRKNGHFHDLIVEEPMIIGKNEDITPYVQRYSSLLEKHIREYPDQWLWMHKRWKVTPLKKILVLDDGKKGHLKQSMSVVKEIRGFRSDEGYADEHLKVDVVRIKYRNKVAKVLLNAIGPFVNTSFQWHLKCLKLALEEDSYNELVSKYADVVVSCGSSLFGVNRLMKLENTSRNVTVLDPGSLYRDKFDLVIMPKHDVAGDLGKRDNVVVTDLAPNLIDPDELSGVREELNGGKDPAYAISIGLLVGGDNKYFSFGDPLVASLMDALTDACRSTGARLYASTSRRTPESAENIMMSGLKSAAFCEAMVSGRSDTDEKTVEKILAVSDIVVVSGESISMVSEAVSSGRTVLVFMPEKRKNGDTKYERFVEELNRKGSVRLVAPEDIPGEVERVAGKGAKTTLPEDSKRIRRKLYKLF